MARARDTSSVTDRVGKHRKRLRDQGSRPIQLWVPDTRRPEFAEEARRQSEAIAGSEHAADDQAFIDALSDPDE
ncbi:antitoxin MazE family protein [Candidatus Poriferisodalis sp.]|uniref:antitoxin MazE family protein n=1 Tax=Candidatus Poriferisodalis sp. TaxID=3101277 RepID=UPI003D140567